MMKVEIPGRVLKFDASHRHVIAIDPDVDKSGLAILDVDDKKFIYMGTEDIVSMYGFFEYVHCSKGFVCNSVVVIEDSDNLHNWHLPPHCSLNMAAAIGKKVGLCHATQRHIKEIAEAHGHKTVFQAPLKKTWMGKDGKITQEELEQFIPDFPKKSNQEIRDSVLLAWCYANLPIHIPANFYVERAKKEFEAKVRFEERFLMKAKGIQPDKDGKYHPGGILEQIKQAKK